MIRLDHTSGGAVASAISAERHRQGSPTTGMVLTLLILSDEEHQADATNAAITAARQHPMRIVTLIPRPSESTPRVDAEISVGGDNGPGEVAIVRLRGEVAQHANSVAIPLLLSDTPVVAFWPGRGPDIPGDDAIGRHAQRRICDAAIAPDPLEELHRRARGYRPGDTDLSWTRLTPWRTALAGVWDQDHGSLESVTIVAEEANPSAYLLQTWLHLRLRVPVESTTSDLPGISSVTFHTSRGDIRIDRHDASGHGTLSRPDQPPTTVTIPRRELPELLAEELRRLDPDEVFAEVLHAIAEPHTTDG